MKIPACPKCNTMAFPAYQVVWVCVNPDCDNYGSKVEPQWVFVAEEGRHSGAKPPGPERAKAIEGASREEEVTLLRELMAKYPEVRP